LLSAARRCDRPRLRRRQDRRASATWTGSPSVDLEQPNIGWIPGNCAAVRRRTCPMGADRPVAAVGWRVTGSPVLWPPSGGGGDRAPVPPRGL